MNELTDTKKYESFLNMWRTLIALSHLDNIVSEQERELIQEFIHNAKLSEEDKEILRQDLEQRHRPDEFIGHVNYPAHLSQLHHLANILFRSDELDPKEEAYLKKILAEIETKIGIYNATTQSAEALKKMSQSEIEVKRKSAFAEIIKFFTK
ncbi:DUF533 domain-containing protein [Halobacteriovorax vibrionivorans]|uniref:DUF533 domain-containing protein n=1 Tax=Halobacteriovorax vibrionivorans TaxID=2152716 RepID=A0ABY0IFB2_9BACT|nr:MULTISPECIES: DUF533 domain-containing protein [Halobacteriovorax]RZF21327.1 DUF533 domain-containing protein [Halobacteriovorax vibrionivorans]TGD47915.1 DUF533 domain-containing protein [Halobacteriovorax sp. Y22]